MSALADAPLIDAEDRAEWRAWLEANHATAAGAWLVLRRAQTGRTTLAYEAAVEEALCFGWVDSTTARIDDERRRQYFAPRKPRSAWAASNKERIERLIHEGRMTPAGMAAIERAKANGSWDVLASSERLEVPADLAAALAASHPAAEHFAAFPPSARKMLLGWVATARRAETRAARISKVAEAAARNERAVG
jgi:uncharacterized protein YdeI (YjbR/CyaY-like superfamily)